MFFTVFIKWLKVVFVFCENLFLSVFSTPILRSIVNRYSVVIVVLKVRLFEIRFSNANVFGLCLITF